ncbi:hypothetical protein [Myxosarcina sp. GI1]|uniref:hypothetical protein n=1 Tax=Myxosarcina sp. GI1 TaxID=1541065 RepID=UPI0012E00DC3|nr:hypothetical protein [Myxosarcina sp. GI1]
MTLDLEYEFTRFSYNNHSVCVNSNNLNLVEVAIINLLGQEGYRQIPKPPLPQNDKLLIQTLCSSPWEIMSYLKVIAISIGNYGWSVIKAFPSELFCRRAKKTKLPLLARLASQQKFDAFHNTVLQRYWGVLIEANSSGRTLASGYLDSDYMEYIRFYTKRIQESKGYKNFSLIEVPREFQWAGSVSSIFNEREKQKREEELELLYQSDEKEIRDKAWSEWKELNMSWFERRDEDLGKLICKSDFFWHENKLLYKAYAEPEQLEKDRVRLLFFQTGRFDLDPSTEEIWSPITSRKDYGIERDIPF